MVYRGQETSDSTQITHRGKLVSYIKRDAMLNELGSVFGGDTQNIILPPGYAHRPDLISDALFNTVTKDKLILLLNSIKDPIQELNAGDSIIIPVV